MRTWLKGAKGPFAVAPCFFARSVRDNIALLSSGERDEENSKQPETNRPTMV